MQVSDKETRAVFLNFKELRCLEKNLQALDIEKAYSISLINLDQKIVKLSNKRLRDKVSKIKSYLPEGDIDELRWLDKMGKLGTSASASKSNCKVRIAAAEKRLKLQPRAKSAVPRIETAGSSAATTPRSVLSARRCSTRLQSARRPSTMERANDTAGKRKQSFLIEARSQTSGEDMSDFPVPRSVRDDRRKSISMSILNDSKNNSDFEKKVTPREAFVRQHSTSDIKNNDNKGKDITNDKVTITVDACDEGDSTKKQDATNTSQGSQIIKPSSPNVSFLNVPDPSSSQSKSTTNDSKPRPFSVPATKVTSFAAENPRSFTSMSHLNDVRKKCASNIRRASRLLASGKTKTPFSCHNDTENEDKAKANKAKPFRSIRDGVYAEIEKGPMENTLGSNLHKEIKRGLMLGEIATSLQLEDKIDNYMDKVQNYVKEHPTAWEPYKPPNDADYYMKDQSGDAQNSSKDKSNVKLVRNKARRQQLEFKLRQGTAQTIFLQSNFADIKKSRYLRIPDSMIDLSGVNTLAVDQMKMFSSMKGGADWIEESGDM